LAHSWALKEQAIFPIRRQRPLIVRSAALRRCALTLLNDGSIGGVYVGNRRRIEVFVFAPKTGQDVAKDMRIRNATLFIDASC